MKVKGTQKKKNTKSLSKKSRPLQTIGSFLRQKRIDNNYTQQEIGEALGVHLMFVSRFELNKCPVPSKHLKKLIKLYRINPEVILKMSLELEKNRLEKILA